MTSVRRRPTPALVNLRDVGRSVGHGLAPDVLWRSEAPRTGDARPALDAWPPRTVIDLRSPHEAAAAGAHPLAAAGAEVVALPLLGALSPEEQAELLARGITLTMLYDRLLDAADTWLPRLVAVAASAPAPLLVHCAAGKDRTGVVVAILLGLLDVPRPAIVADYLATGDVLDDLLPRLDVSDDVLASPLVGVDEEAVVRVLDRVGADAAAFSRAHGVADQDVARWRERAQAGGRGGVSSRRS